jgi:heme/copper-type cytochrome/quinol oxidase subunit 3
MTEHTSTPTSAVTPVTSTVGHVVESAHDKESSTENRKFAMWLFLGSEVVFFTILIAGLVFARLRAPEEHNVLNIPLTSLNTFVLLTSSFTVVRALAAMEVGDRTKFLRSLALTGLLGTVFLLVQIFEYSHLGQEGLTLSGSLTDPKSIFGMAFFTLTGFHGVHVLVGVLWLGRVFWNGFNGKYTQHDYFDVEFFGLYWHFVDVVWILIFTIVYLI